MAALLLPPCIHNLFPVRVLQACHAFVLMASRDFV